MDYSRRHCLLHHDHHHHHHHHHRKNPLFLCPHYHHQHLHHFSPYCPLHGYLFQPHPHSHTGPKFTFPPHPRNLEPVELVRLPSAPNQLNMRLLDARVMQGDTEGLEMEDEEEPVFVLTDEWREFFAQSGAKRRLEKKHTRKKGKN